MLIKILQVVIVLGVLQYLVGYLQLVVFSTARRPPAKPTMSFRAVFVTVPTIEVAKSLASGIVSKKLAACVNIIPQVTSVYEWEGKINEDSELILMIKTQAHLFEELSNYVKANHPYDVPEVIALPIEQGSSSYLDWIKKVTTRH